MFGELGAVAVPSTCVMSVVPPSPQLPAGDVDLPRDLEILKDIRLDAGGP